MSNELCKLKKKKRKENNYELHDTYFKFLF